MAIPPIKHSEQNWRNPSVLDYQPPLKKKPRKEGKINWKKIFSTLFPIALFLLVLGAVAFFGLFLWVSKDLPSPDGVINRSVTVSSKIYDREGKTVLYDIHGDVKRTVITLNEIPGYAIKATLAAEDRDFYNHSGFSITGIIRSVFINITTGKRVGGSTLTQQFVKNAILTNEKTYTRKIKEFILSYRIEKKFTKDQILQMYFNEIPYGSVIYGIEAASQSFFGKPAKDLTLGEATILAAIPQRPTYFSPYGNNKDQLIIRQRYVLDSMVKLGYITKEQGEAAKQEKIIFKPLNESILAPHFVMYIKDILSEKYGEEFINQQGLKITTSLDLNKQKIAEEAVKQGIEANSAKYGFTNASLVSLDPKTGQVLAMVGSADYFNDAIDGQVNVSLRPRQPGSSFKPIVYAASFIKGYTPNTVLYDVVTNFDTTGANKYEPKNYNLKENGPVTIRKALAGSLNIPAVKATYLTGLDNIFKLTKELGYSTLEDKNRFGLSIVLGGAEVKLLEHADAYGAFANDGLREEVNPILKIEDASGKVLYEFEKKEKKVYEPEIARQISSILSDDSARAFTFGAGSKLTLPGRPVAAKTGTTNDYKDAWCMGYTPSLVTGVWVGNNNSKSMKTGADGSIIAAPIWNYYMKEALKDTPVEQFNAPEQVITGKPVLDGDTSGGQTVKIDSMSGLLATQYTPSSTIEEITTQGIHDILYYINKDDPRGPAPSNPASDPQFNNWESAVARWAAQKNIQVEDTGNIPTEYDNIHLAEDQIRLSIITPLPGQKITDNNLEVDISAVSKRGVKTINYYINNELVLTKKDTNLALINLSQYSDGQYILRVEAMDDLKNTSIQEVNLNFSLNKPSPLLTFTSPRNNESINTPINVKYSLNNYQNIKKIDFYYQKEGDKVESYLNTIESNSSKGSFILNKPLSSSTAYYLYANIFTQDGKKYQSDKIRFLVK